MRISSLLVFGGARSGKSRYAQEMAENAGLEPWLIATAQAFDGEMVDRIARHRAERGSRWHLLEEPLHLAESLAQAAQPGRIVLVDCLTLWLSNLMLAEIDMEGAGAALASAVPRLRSPVIFVSNEVGTGIVPENALARRFRDAQGRLNQTMAQACEAVLMVQAGLPVQLKPGVRPEFRFGTGHATNPPVPMPVPADQSPQLLRMPDTAPPLQK